MKKFMSSVKQLIIKYREIIMYVFCGGVTTAVNWLVYFVMKDAFSIHYMIAQVTSWAVSVIAAFFMNKYMVFGEKSKSSGTFIKQFLEFASMRVLSGLFETGFLWLCVDVFHLSENIFKLAASVVVVILNYIASKLLIFKKKK